MSDNINSFLNGAFNDSDWEEEANLADPRNHGNIGLEDFDDVYDIYEDSEDSWEVARSLEGLKDKALFMAGYCSPFITDAMRIKAWSRLTGYYLYMAGLYWSGITDNIRANNLPRLEGEWLRKGGMEWKGITDSMRKNVLHRIEEDYKVVFLGWPFFKRMGMENAANKLWEHLLIPF